MKKLVLFVTVCLILGSVAFAQDPGFRDTIIIKGYSADTGYTGFIPVQIFAVTDDSVATYNLPITWNSVNNSVFPGIGTQYFPPIIQWSEHYDSILTAEHFIRQWGIYDTGDTLTHPPLLTHGSRVNAWTLHFFLAPGAPPQTVTIDTVTDNRTGPLLFGLTDGLTEFKPVVVIQSPIRITGIDENGDVIPSDYTLNQNYPNPFNPQTNIEFSLPRITDVSLVVYNLLGQEVRTLVNDKMAAGSHTALWDGRDHTGSVVPSGVYFYRLYTPEFTQTNKMVLIR